MSDNNDDLKYLPFTCLVRDDETNERTHYDEAGLVEMKDSIRENGILQNLGVTERADGNFDVVWGFRRHKGVEALISELVDQGTEEAMELAQNRALVPVKILTGAEATKAKLLQAIENLQKEGVAPVDEARGYQKLLAMAEDDGTPVYASYEALAVALGKRQKGESYIRKRIKLLDAPDFLLDAIRDGVVASVRIGEMIGAMASTKDRETMARLAIKHPQLGIPMSTCQVQEWIERHFNKSLAEAGFDLLSTELLDGAQKAALGFMGAAGAENDGSCQRCLLRTGNDPLLKEEMALAAGGGDVGRPRGLSPLTCQAPHCLRLKQENAWKIIEGQAEASGLRVMDRVKAKTLWVDGAYGGEVAKDYVRKDYRPDYDCTGHMAEESMPTWGEIFDGMKLSWILVQQPKKKGFVYVYERSEAIEQAEALWKGRGEANLFAGRPALKAKSENRNGKSEVSEDSRGGGELGLQVESRKVDEPEKKEEAAKLVAGPSKEEIRAKYNELVFAELVNFAEGCKPPVGLWLAQAHDTIYSISQHALQLAVVGFGIERNVKTLPATQLRTVLEAYVQGRTSGELPMTCLMLELSQAIVNPQAESATLVKASMIFASLTSQEMLDRAVKALTPEKPKPVKVKKTTGTQSVATFPGEADEMVFLDRLMNEPVPVSEPNSSKVFEQPVRFGVQLGGTQGLMVELATDAGGWWYTVVGYNLGDKCSGSRLPHISDRSSTRVLAVSGAVHDLRFDRNVEAHPKALAVMERVFEKWTLLSMDGPTRPPADVEGNPLHGDLLQACLGYRTLAPAEKNWLAVLMMQAVLVAPPNEHGVLSCTGPEPLVWKGAKKGEHLNLRLAVGDRSGRWYFDYDLQTKICGEGGPACVDSSPNFETRQAAVYFGLCELEQRAVRRGAAAVSALNAIRRLRAVMVTVWPDLPEVQVRPAEPTTEANREIGDPGLIETRLEPRVEMWLNNRLCQEVLVTTPNAHGVFLEPAGLRNRLDIGLPGARKGSDFLALTLATDAQGKWYSGIQYSYRAAKTGGGSGGGLPNVKEPCSSRVAAIRDALIGLGESLSKQAVHGHAMIKAMLAKLAGASEKGQVKSEKGPEPESAEEVAYDAEAELKERFNSYCEEHPESTLEQVCVALDVCFDDAEPLWYAYYGGKRIIAPKRFVQAGEAKALAELKRFRKKAEVQTAAATKKVAKKKPAASKNCAA
jgi:ParB-like chromosome segregation protein Spo0J